MRAPQTLVTEFSRFELRNGVTRAIAVLSRVGDRPAVVVSICHGPGRFTRTRFFPNELDILERAVADARDPELTGRRDAGRIPHGDELVVCVWADRNWVDRPAVCFGRQNAERNVGGATRLTGDEIGALERAIAFARKIHSGTAAQRQEQQP